MDEGQTASMEAWEAIDNGDMESRIGKGVGTSGAAVNKRKARMRKELLQAIA